MIDGRPTKSVVGPYATCIEGVWRSHPSLDAGVQYVRRRLPRSGDVAATVWQRGPQSEWGLVSFEAAPCRRPYGARSGRSPLPRLEVCVPPSLLGALERARGTQSRAAWIRAAIQSALGSEQPFHACKNCALKRGGM
jgi:hypothetical protein